MELGDKETVAICIQASVTCYLHVIHRYTRMVRTIRVWSYRTRMVYKIVPYAYGTYHTRMVCTIRVRYKIRVWYRTMTYNNKWPHKNLCVFLYEAQIKLQQIDICRFQAE